ncbi:MAG: hypothetical protein AAFZ05_15210, partial [Pseudomonadota bacterium]
AIAVDGIDDLLHFLLPQKTVHQLKRCLVVQGQKRTQSHTARRGFKALQVIDTVYRYCGQKESVIFCDQIMSMGFKEAFKAGISFGKDDMLIPDTKWTIVDDTREQVKDFEQQYMDGLITQGEKYNKVIDAWSKANDKVTDAMMGSISSAKTDESGAEAEPNSVYMMAHSGARGSVTQMKQLGGMRGLMA